MLKLGENEFNKRINKSIALDYAFIEMQKEALIYRDAQKPFDLDKAKKCIEEGCVTNECSFAGITEISVQRIWAMVEEGDLLAISAAFFGMNMELLDALLAEKEGS